MCIGVSIFSTVWYINATNKIETLKSLLTFNQCDIAEGNIRLIYRHSKRDILELDGLRFELRYFEATDFYNINVEHGGVLKDGVYAKIYHKDGDILKVELNPNLTLKHP